MYQRLLTVVLVCLIAHSKVISSEEETNSVLRSPSWTRENSNVLFDEAVWDIGTESFSYAVCDKKEKSSNIECSLTRTIVDSTSPDWLSQKKCDLKFTGGEGLEVKVVSLRTFLYPEIIVIKWLEMQDNMVKNAKLTFVKVKECNTITESFEVNLSIDDPLFVHEFFEGFEDYEIIISSEKSCVNSTRCMIYYLPFSDEKIETAKRVPFRLNMTDMKFHYSQGSGLFVQGHDRDTKNFKAIYISENGIENLLTSETPQMTSCKARDCVVCNTTQSSDNKNLVNCNEYIDDDLQYNLSQTYDMNEKLLGVKLRNQGKEVSLVSKKEDGNLHMIVFKQGKKVDDSEIEFKPNCSNDKKSLVLDIEKFNSIPHLVYGCEQIDEKDAEKNLFLWKKQPQSDLHQ